MKAHPYCLVEHEGHAMSSQVRASSRKFAFLKFPSKSRAHRMSIEHQFAEWWLSPTLRVKLEAAVESIVAVSRHNTNIGTPGVLKLVVSKYQHY